MIDALNTAMSGMRLFSTRAGEAAREIVDAGLSAHSALQTVPQSQVKPTPPPAAPLAPQPDLARGVVNLKLAEIGYKASAKVAAAVSDMHRQLLDVVK